MESVSVNKPQQAAPKQKKRFKSNPYAKKIQTSHVNIAKVKLQALNTIARDVRHLLEKSYVEILKKDQAQSIVNYVKILRDLEKEERLAIDELSLEELEQIASKLDTNS